MKELMRFKLFFIKKNDVIIKLKSLNIYIGREDDEKSFINIKLLITGKFSIYLIGRIFKLIRL